MFEDPLYERDDTPVDPVPRYNEETDSFYDQETDGAGFDGDPRPQTKWEEFNPDE